MKGFRMTDEYKKLHASLAVLGSAIKKVEAHLAKHPAKKEAFADISEEYWEQHPISPDDEYDKFEVQLRLEEHSNELVIGCMQHYRDGFRFDVFKRLSDCSSNEMIAYSSHLPNLIEYADSVVSELADEAENIAGEIEQALANAAKKPERKPKTKAKA